MGDFAQHSIKGSCLTALTQIFANAKTSFMLGTLYAIGRQNKKGRL